MMSQEQETRTSTQAASSHFVIVTLGQRFFAINADTVQGVVDTSEVVNTGASEFRGEVYRTIDLTNRLSFCRTQNQPSAQVLFLSLGQTRGRLVVDRVHGRLVLHASQVLALPPHFQGAERHWYHGMILFKNSVALILNLSVVVEECGNRQPGRAQGGSRPIEIEGTELHRNSC